MCFVAQKIKDSICQLEGIAFKNRSVKNNSFETSF